MGRRGSHCGLAATASPRAGCIGSVRQEEPVTVDTHDMLLIHRVLRRELGQLPHLIRSASGDLGRAKRLAGHLGEMLDFLHHHHIGEDELLWPVLRPRVMLEGELIDRMESQHEQVAAAVTAVQADLPTWSRTADAEVGERMAGVIEQAVVVLTEHLAEEESLILPLVSKHFSQSEWDALGEHGFAAIPGRRRLVILAHILEEADADEQRQFLKVVPLPARVAYRVVGRRQHAREVRLIRR